MHKELVPWTLLKNAHLKRLALLTGQSGKNKAELMKAVARAASKPRLLPANGKILSIDMGVKNLAFCVISPNLSRSKQNASGVVRLDRKSPFNLHEWATMDVSKPAPSPTDLKADDEDPGEAENLFSPTNLSKAAVKLVEMFLRYEPSAIIIERQRFRSGGAPMIQEWTVRVNMLESMLWASLRSPGWSLTPRPSLWEMSPARVAAFWNSLGSAAELNSDAVYSVLAKEGVGEAGAAVSDKASSRGFEKKEKVELVRRWFGINAVTSSSKSVNELIEYFTAGRSTKRSKASVLTERQADAVVPKKLDDLADCVVQGVTFAFWEENSRAVRDCYGDLQNKVGDVSGG